ncbi:MAG TPA: hypothetical protein PKA03_05860 [Tabrizicola sp.]|nr:hypothetical protein [Tabrizicola sp.]
MLDKIEYGCLPRLIPQSSSGNKQTSPFWREIKMVPGCEKRMSGGVGQIGGPQAFIATKTSRDPGFDPNARCAQVRDDKQASAQSPSGPSSHELPPIPPEPGKPGVRTADVGQVRSGLVDDPHCPVGRVRLCLARLDEIPSQNSDGRRIRGHFGSHTMEQA